MDNLKIDAPVKVKWEESGSQFTGVIIAVNENGSYDILYDEKVGDKSCLERQVLRSRIEHETMDVQDKGPNPAVSQTIISADENIETDYWIETDTDGYKSANDRSKTVSRLLQVNKSISEEAVDSTVEVLDNHEVLHLHDALTPLKAMELLRYNSSSVSTIVSLLTASINTNCSETHSQASYAELWAEHVEEAHGKPKVSEWLASLSSAEDSALSGTVALHGALAALLRLQAAFNSSQLLADQAFSLHARPTTERASINIAEETIDRAMRGVTTFLNVNFLSTLAGDSAKQGVSKGKGKTKIDVNSKAVADVAKIVFPTVTSILDALQLCFRSGRQSERLGLSAAELALAVLRTDPVTAPVLEALSGSSSVLVSLHRAACALLREVFVHHPTHRKGLLVELLAQLSQTFTAKAPYRSYPLHNDASAAAGEGVRYASMSVVALLGCLQSVVSASESLVAKKSKFNKTDSPSATVNAVTASKTKGKKGSKDHSVDTAEAADSPSASTAAVHTPENAKKSIIQSYVCCSSLAADLFQRCTHKEVSGDYRNLATCLVSELLTLLQLPAWPSAAVLLEQILLNVLKQLNSSMDAADTVSAKKDASYTPFLLDLLGSACVGLRSVLVVSEREHKAAQSCVLSSAVISSVSKKITALRPDWEATSMTNHTSAATSHKKGTKQTPAADVMDVSAALSALLEVTSSTIDANEEAPLYTAETEEGEAASEIASLPPPLDILRALPQHADLVRLFPDLSPLDLQYHHVCTFLLHSLTRTSGAPTAPTATSSSAVTGQDALEGLLCTWYLGACTEGRSEVAAYLYGRLEAFAVYKSDLESVYSGSSGGAGRGGSKKHFSLTATHATTASGVNAWSTTSATQPTASRANFSFEAILAANRALLSARSVGVMFERVLDAILSLTTESTPGVRARAVKMLSLLLQCDNDLIQNDHVRYAVTNRLLDRAISVREESVKLLGYYVVRGYQNLAAPYLEGLKERLHDEGISVRKSVVLLFKEILLHQPEHPQYTQLCLSLLEKAAHPKEEESIREIIRGAFQQVWFLPPSAASVQQQMQVQSALRLRRQSSTASVGSVNSVEKGGLRSGVSSTHSLSQSFTGTVLYSTPGSLSVPALSRASSCTSVGYTYEQTGGEVQLSEEGGGEGVEHMVSPLSQCSPRGADSSASGGQVLQFFSPAELPLSIDTAIDTEGEGIVNPIVTAGSRTPGYTPSIVSMRTPNNTSTPAAVSTPAITPKEALREHIRSTSLQLVDMAALDGSSNTSGSGGDNSATDWMVSLLREVLHGSGEGDEGSAQLKQRRAGSFRYCEQIVACLVELLLCTEEQQPEIMQLLRTRGKDAKAQCVNIIRTVALFCTAHPPFISKHLKTLLPYLKHDNSYTKEQNALIKLKVTEVVTATASIDCTAFSFNLTELVGDLKKCALNLSGKNIRAAVNCLSLLAENVTKDALPLFQLADTCFRGIRSIATAVPDCSLLSPTHLGNLQRCLIVLGYVCECTKKCGGAMESLAKSFAHNSNELKALTPAARSVYFSAEANTSIAKRDVSAVELLHPSALHGACYAASIYALTVQNAAVQIRGAQALCGVFAGYPRLMMLAQQEGLLSALLGEGYDDAVHERFIMAIRDMMVLEEERLEAQQALRLMKDSGVAVVEADVVMSNQGQDAESTIPGFALQQHLPELISFLAHPSSALRHTTLQLVGTLLRQGMLCPIDVVAPLIALQCDADAKIRHEALTVLQIEDEKHPTFIGSRMVDGIELCHDFQLRTQGIASTLDTSCAVRKGVQRVSLLGDFFSSCVQHPRRRKELLDGLLHRTYRILTKHREGLAQHTASYDLILQAQAAEQRLLKEEQQSALMISEDNASDGTASGTQPVSSLKRSTSFSTSSAKKTSDPALHLQTVLDAYSKAGASDFIACTLAFLPYDVIEEPLQLVYYINRNVAVGTSLLLHRLRQQLLCMGGQLRKGGAMQPPVLGSKPRGGAGGKSVLSSAGTSRPFLDNNGPLEGDVDLLVSEAAFSNWLDASLAEKSSPKQPSVAVVRVCELIVLALELRCNEAVLRLKSFVKLAYGLSDDRCSAFNPDERSLSLSAAAAAASTATADKLGMSNASLAFQPHPPNVANITELLSVQQLTAFASQALKFCAPSTSSSAESTADTGRGALLELMRQVAMDYNRITLLLNSDPEDFTMSAASTQAGAAAKRKRRPAATPADGEKKTAGRKPKAAAGKVADPGKKAKRARKVVNLSDEDEDNSGDEDWEE